jgi:hypothetical protein
MNNLSNIRFTESKQLKCVTFVSEETRKLAEHQYASKEFFFELKSEMNFKFRLVFKIHVNVKEKKVDLTIIGQQYIDCWQRSTTSTHTICNWVNEDVEMIVNFLLKEVEREFPEFQTQDKTGRKKIAI